MEMVPTYDKLVQIIDEGAVTHAHIYIFGSEPPAPPSAETSMWRDLNVFNEVGIPSICYGPPRQREPMSGA
ncbi:MAG TPA: hypothetical protein VGB27_00200 [Candidatus Binatia bacterium]